MTDSPDISGSLRNRLALMLIGGAALLAVLLFFAVRDYAVQVAQQGQDNILAASVTSMLDAAALRDGDIEVDIPYAAFSMLAPQLMIVYFTQLRRMANFCRATTSWFLMALQEPTTELSKPQGCAVLLFARSVPVAF